MQCFIDKKGFLHRLQGVFLVFPVFLVLAAFSGSLPAADETPPAEEAVAEPGEEQPANIGSIPPLDRRNDPFAISMKDHLGGKPPAVAGNLAVDELINAAKELTDLVKSSKPDFENYSENMLPMAHAQLKIRALMETAKFFASHLPEDQQAPWKAAAKERFGPVMTETDIALSGQAMLRASREIASLALDFNTPYVDSEELYQKALADFAPPASPPAGSSMGSMGSPMGSPGGSSMGSMGSTGMPSTYGMSSSSGGGNLTSACKNFFAAYKPGPVDDKKMENVVNGLIAPGRTHLQGYMPKKQGQGSGTFISDYSRSTAGTMQPRRTGGLNLGGSPGQTNITRDDLDEPVRQSIAFALKMMLRDENTKIGAKIATAYCAFAVEDYVPEVALYLERADKALKEKDLDLLVSFPIEADYANDPRVDFLLVRTLFMISPSMGSQSVILDAFDRAPGTARFLVAGLDRTKTIRDMVLTILFEIGDGDSAIHVAKLLGDKTLPLEYRKSILAILGQTGDQRVGSPLLKCLPDPELQESAKDALIRIGSPAESATLTIFNAKKPEFDRIALEILSKIGSWKALSKLGAQLALYAGAKTREEAAKAEEKPKLILETKDQNELMQLTIETGTLILARMTGTPAPDFKKKTTTGTYGTSMPGYGMSGSGPMPTPTGSGYGSGYGIGSGSSTMGYSGMGGSSKVEDPKAPRKLVKKGEMSPGNAPVYWMQGLAIAGTNKFEEIAKVLGRVTNYDTGKKAGEEMQSLNWATDYFLIAGLQVKNHCVPLLEPDARKSVEGSLTRIANRFEKVKQERNRIGKSNSPREGFEDGFSPKARTSGMGSGMP